MKSLQHIAPSLFCMVGVVVSSGAPQAHPHVWHRTTVLFDQGRITGFRHAWTFDEMYSAMAVAGLDRDGDGNYSRDELAELAKINAESLKEFSYFTFARLGTNDLALAPPQDYWLEFAAERLTLHFVLPLAEPILAEAQGFAFTVVDETFFIAFDPAKDEPIALGEGVPSGCIVSVAVPQEDLAQLQQLNSAFSGVMTAGDANIGMGTSYAPTAFVSCPHR